MMQRGELFRDRKFYIFVGLLVVLVVVNLNQWGRSSRLTTRAREAKSPHPALLSGDPILLAEKLSDQKVEFQEEKRNIFAFFQSPASTQAQIARQAAPPAPPDPVCGNGLCEQTEDPLNCPGDCQPPPPPAPVITLRYIGYLNQTEGSVAFLTDGKEVYMGRVNDVIANQYRVLKITEDAVELGFLNNNQSSTIRFQGSQGG